MAQFENLFTNFIIIGLIVFGLLAFVVTLQKDNTVSEKFIENPTINNTYGTLGTNLADVGSKSQAQKTLFESENPTAGFGTILLFSIVSAGKIFNGMIIAVFNTIIKLPVVFLGLDSTVVSVISAILILGIILGLWAVYKLGG